MMDVIPSIHPAWNCLNFPFGIKKKDLHQIVPTTQQIYQPFSDICHIFRPICGGLDDSEQSEKSPLKAV